MYVCVYVCMYVCMYVIQSILVFLNNEQNLSKICVDGNYVLLGFYATSSGNSLPTLRGNLSFPPSRVKNSKRTPVTLVCVLYSEGCGRG
jgi:hypothetical protein